MLRQQPINIKKMEILKWKHILINGLNVENIYLFHTQKRLHHILHYLRVRDTGQFHWFLEAYSTKQRWSAACRTTLCKQSEQLSQTLRNPCLWKWEQRRRYGLSAKLLQTEIVYQPRGAFFESRLGWQRGTPFWRVLFQMLAQWQ